MRYETFPLRPGVAALAAVLVLSSTPLLAQSTDTDAAVPAASVAITPPPPAATTPVPVVTAVPVAPPMATSSTPVVHLPDAAAIDSAATSDAPAAATAHRTAKPVAVTTRTTTARTVKSTKSTISPDPDPIAAVPSTPVAGSAIPALPPAPLESAPQPVPVPAAASDETTDLAVAGALALALLMIVGGAIYLVRRQRLEEGVYESIRLDGSTTVAPPEPMPAFVAAPQMAPAPVADPAAVPKTELPDGFDISRYGPHVQAAYRGPTEDNPSLSLKTRLKRARFLDQRERAASKEQAREARLGDPFILQPENGTATDEPALQI